MITHRDTIIQVTFTANGKRYEDYALQSADYAFVQTVNPYRYKFADLKEIREFLAEEKKRILANQEDDWSYFKHFVLGDRNDKQDGNHIVSIWARRKKDPEHLRYNDIVIERAIAWNKATDTWTDITKEFCDVWNLGHNPNPQVRKRKYNAVIEFPATIAVNFSALENLSKKELMKKAIDEFWKDNIKKDVRDLATWGKVKVSNLEMLK